MARHDEDDALEPILPRHPPLAASDDAPAGAGPPADATAPAGRRPWERWERWLLLGCALASTLALSVCALRLNAIAADQRVQTCQVEVYLREQLAAGPRGGIDLGDRDMRARLGECIGVDVDADTGDGSGD